MQVYEEAHVVEMGGMLLWKIHTPNDLTAIVRIMFFALHMLLSLQYSWCSQGDPKTDNSPQHLS